MSVVHIITAGTSLLENLNIKNWEMQLASRLNSISLNNIPTQIFANNFRPSSVEKNLWDKLINLNIANEILKRGAGRKDGDLLPQEISYLILHYYKLENGKLNPRNHPKNKKDKVFLIPSGTSFGYFAALMIEKYINSCDKLKDLLQVEVTEPIDGLDPDNPRDFETKGIDNLHAEIEKIVSTNRKEEIILNVTGGFKGTIPYQVVLGMCLRGIKMKYLFEDSKDMITLPSYPINVNFPLWHRNALRFMMATSDSTDSIKNEYKKLLPEEMKSLILEKQSSISTMAEILQNTYQEQTKIDPLQYYSEQVVDWFLKDDGDLKGILKNLILRVGPLIWTGDKVPEMMEHGLRHHHDLLELAEMFLIPIIAVNSDLLTQKERFVLLSSILLHDCGHTLVSLKRNGQPFLLFPSQIRSLHQFLSYERLGDSTYQKELNFTPNNNLLEYVRLACCYHRKKMPFTLSQKNDPSWKGCKKLFVTGDEVKALEEYNSKYNEVDLLKVVALLRLIDGCDIQTRRAGSGEKVELMLKILERDARIQREKYEQYARPLLEEAITSSNNSDLKSKIASLFQFRNNRTMPNSPYDSEQAREEIHVLCWDKVHDPDCNTQEKRLARTWLFAEEAYDTWQYLERQKEHYLKHQSVSRVLVIPKQDFSVTNLDFNIEVQIDQSNLKRYADHIRENCNNAKGKIKDEIEGEPESVKEKLGELKITWEMVVT